MEPIKLIFKKDSHHFKDQSNSA